MAAAAAAAAAPMMEMREELVEAFLLRVPPDDPASLVRAALVCKLWRRILADRGFRRRFHELHRRPPMLGFLAFLRSEAGSSFTPTSSFRPRKRTADYQGWYAIDSRHGRVLLASSLLFCQNLHTAVLAVWDPISGDRLKLPKLPALSLHPNYTWNAAVLCASNPSSAGDNTECHSGHFLVVLMVTNPDRVYVFVYWSQDGTWSETISATQDLLDQKFLIPWERNVLANNALYFKFNTWLISGILKYDMGMQEISSINLPSNYRAGDILLTTTDTDTEYGGSLGIARLEGSRLHLWSREAAGPAGHLGWAPSRVIELNTVLPATASTHLIRVDAFVHGGLGAFLVSTDDGVFSVDLESNQARKVCEGRCGINVVPYVCYCTPDVALNNTGEGPGASVPST